jgi:hypothetical protein
VWATLLDVVIGQRNRFFGVLAASSLTPGDLRALREPASDPAHQLIEVRPPPGSVYAVAHGQRKIIWTQHKPGVIKRWPLYVTPPRRRSRSPAVVLGRMTALGDVDR